MYTDLPKAYRDNTPNTTESVKDEKTKRTYYLNSIISIAETLRDCPQNNLLIDLSELVDEYGRTWGVSPKWIEKQKKKKTKEEGSFSKCMIINNRKRENENERDI